MRENKIINITPQQHSKILGFALIAYGFQYVFDAFRITRIFSGEVRFAEDIPFYAYLYFLLFDTPFTAFWYFLFSILSGILIVYSNGKFKFISLLFVILNINVFPIGTILSFYTLWYLFVESENKIAKEQIISKEA